MADLTYQPNVYMKQDDSLGNAELVAASGGIIRIESGGILAAGTSTTKAATIADPTGGSTSTGGTATTGGLDTKARAAIVSIITALDGVGITATA